VLTSYLRTESERVCWEQSPFPPSSTYLVKRVAPSFFLFLGHKVTSVGRLDRLPPHFPPFTSSGMTCFPECLSEEESRSPTARIDPPFSGLGFYWPGVFPPSRFFSASHFTFCVVDPFFRTGFPPAAPFFVRKCRLFACLPLFPQWNGFFPPGLYRTSFLYSLSPTSK